MRGIVKDYDQKRHFGFIWCVGSEKHGKKVICNKKDLINTEYLVEGDLVDFIISRDGNAMITVINIVNEMYASFKRTYNNYERFEEKAKQKKLR